jgi:hypothetical protein
VGKTGKLLAMDVDGLSAISSLPQATHELGVATLAETGFLQFKSEFPLNLKIKYQRLNVR